MLNLPSINGFDLGMIAGACLFCATVLALSALLRISHYWLGNLMVSFGVTAITMQLPAIVQLPRSFGLAVWLYFALFLWWCARHEWQASEKVEFREFAFDSPDASDDLDQFFGRDDDA